jgi:hypothetical protein
MTTEIRSRNSRNQTSCKATTHSFVFYCYGSPSRLHLLAASADFKRVASFQTRLFMMSDIPPCFGFALAGQQPTPVALFSSFDWASNSEPEGDPRDFLPCSIAAKSIPRTLLWTLTWQLLLPQRPTPYRVPLRSCTSVLSELQLPRRPPLAVAHLYQGLLDPQSHAIICSPPTLWVAFSRLLVSGSLLCRLWMRRAPGVTPS